MQSTSQSSVESIVSDFLVRRTGITELEHTQELFDTGIINSLFVIELLAFLEQRFQIKVTMDDLDLERFSTTERISQFVLHKRS